MHTLIAALFGVCSLSAVAFAQSPETPAPAPLVPDYSNDAIVDSIKCDAKTSVGKIYENIAPDGITQYHVIEFTLAGGETYFFINIPGKDSTFFSKATPEAIPVSMLEDDFHKTFQDKAPNANKLITGDDSNDCTRD